MVGSIFTFILFLSILILVHEAGHFFAARRAGVLVEEFGFGLPPRLIGKKIGETLFSINLLPFGGFVRLYGEHARDTITKKSVAFLNKSARVKAGIVVAGVVMNFLLAVFVFAVVYSFLGVPKKTGLVRIVSVIPSSPAEESGLAEGDIVKKVDGEAVGNNQEFVKIVDRFKGEKALLIVDRAGSSEPIEISVAVRRDPPQGEGALGVVITDSEIYFPPIWQRPLLGAYFGFKEAIFWGGTVLLGFQSLIKNLFAGELPKDVVGPAGLYVITSEIARFGILPLLNWLGIISVNLAILNIFPIPAFDGGRLIFIGIEKLFGKKIVPKVESWLQAISLGILITFLLAITFREIRLITSLGFSGYLDYLSGGQGLQ